MVALRSGINPLGGVSYEELLLYVSASSSD